MRASPVPLHLADRDLQLPDGIRQLSGEEEIGYCEQQKKAEKKSPEPEESPGAIKGDTRLRHHPQNPPAGVSGRSHQDGTAPPFYDLLIGPVPFLSKHTVGSLLLPIHTLQKRMVQQTTVRVCQIDVAVASKAHMAKELCQSTVT